MRDILQIGNVSWFEFLSPDDRAELAERSQSRDYAAGETVFSPTPTAQSIYLLERGRARIYRLSKDGLETTFGYIQPGEVFGELAAFDHGVRESYADAIEPLRAWKIPLDLFARLLSVNPAMGFEIAKQVGERLRLAEHRMADLAFRDARTRLVACLLQLMDRFGSRADAGCGRVLNLHLNQTELAQLIGVTRQTVNVSLRELEEAGLVIRRDRRTVLPDVEALRRRIEVGDGG
jgi:CRP/FNR family cyclic AMP-dependent transcriptional regulator